MVAIGIGSNLGNSLRIIERVMPCLERLARAESFLSSSIWVTSPVNCPPGSPNFLNSVVLFELQNVSEKISDLISDGKFQSIIPLEKQRLEILKDVNGAFRCRTAFNCTSACPKGIQVTKAIEDVKRETLLNN